MKKILSVLVLLFFVTFSLISQKKEGSTSVKDDGCTSITVGRLASIDGSVMTSHTCDSRKDRTWIDIVKAKKHKSGEMRKVYLNTHITKSPYDLSDQKFKGEIPEVPITYKYLNSTLPCINEHQVAIGESTFGGKK